MSERMLNLSEAALIKSFPQSPEALFFALAASLWNPCRRFWEYKDFSG